MHPLQADIERYFGLGAEAGDDPRAIEAFVRFREGLEAGEIRAADKVDGRWRVNAWVKQGILLGFRVGRIAESGDPRGLSFVDKDTYPLRHYTAMDGIRVVPGGSSVRSGAYVARSVVCMPP